MSVPRDPGVTGRRQFLAALGVATLSLPARAGAQRRTPLPRIGFVSVGRTATPRTRRGRRARAGITDREIAVRREAVFRLLEAVEVVEPTRPVLARAA